MNIIKHGVDKRKTFLFECARCGCIYTIKEGEKSTCNTIVRMGESIYVECPEPFCHILNKGCEYDGELVEVGGA